MAALQRARQALPGPLLYWILLVLTIGWLYWPALCGEVPAFRDAFHFYYPLECWLAARAEAGQYLPHFNPYDGCGANVIGETSSGLCYPGRVLWWLPGLSVAQRFGVVLVVHTLLAAMGAAYAARRMNLSPAAGCLAATAYALGGPVLFQHANPVYLVGAAWTPWALAECWVLAQPSESKPNLAVWVAAAALMLLGGDPQATVNTGVVALLALTTRLVTTVAMRVFAGQLLWLATAVTIVAGLTAIQWIPARYWLQQSQRAPTGQATALEHGGFIADLPQLLRPLAEAARLDSPAANAPLYRARSTYAYSVAPWHFLTLLWGTLGGHYLPEHTRWPQALHGEPRMWTASLSIGLLPALYVLAGWSRVSIRRPQRFLIVVALVSAAAMLGSHGLVWLLRQALQMAGAEVWSRSLPGDEVGGVYWCLSQLVPGYSSFRYPAKWSVWFACAMALAAATAFDRQELAKGLLGRLCMLVTGLSILAALTVIWLQWLPSGKPAEAAFVRWLSDASSDPWLGHPNAAAVMRLWLQTALAAAAISAACGLYIRLRPRGRQLRALVLLLTLAELGWAGSHWLVTVDLSRLDVNPIEIGSGPSTSETADGTIDERATGDRPLERLWAAVGRADFDLGPRAGVAPTELQPDGVEEICNHQLAFQLGKLHLIRPSIANLSAFLSLTPKALATVRSRLAQADDMRADNPPLDEALAWLGVSRRLVAGESLRWQPVPAARSLIELIDESEVSSDAGPRQPDEVSSRQSPRRSKCAVEHLAPDRLRIKTSSPRASRLVVRLFQDGGWSATLTQQAGAGSETSEIHRMPTPTHLGLFQSLSVPAGDWSIDLAYRAPGWRLGKWITSATLALLVALWLPRFRKQFAEARASTAP